MSPSLIGVTSQVSPAATGSPLYSSAITGTLAVVPPSHIAGDTLILAVIAGSGSGAFPGTPGGWTAVGVSGTSGNPFGVWYKTAVASEPNVTFTLSAGVVLSGVMASYRHATSTVVGALSSSAGSAGNVSFTATLPSGMASGGKAVLIAANAEYGLSGWENLEGQGDMSMTVPWTPQANQFSTSIIPQNSSTGAPLTTYNVGIALSDIAGIPSAPKVTSVQDSSFYSAVIGLAPTASVTSVIRPHSPVPVFSTAM